VGHDFLQLPAHPNEWEKRLERIQPLTELQHIDVVNNLCNLAGMIDEIIHGMQSHFRSLIADRREMVLEDLIGQLDKGFDEIVTLLANNASKVKKQDLIQRFRWEIIDISRVDSIVNFLARAAEEFKSVIEAENEIVGTRDTHSEPYPWKVLVLDAEPESIASILASLAQRGIDLFIVQNVKEAEKAIEEDIYNRIVVAISDYRLYEKVDGVLKHQQRQGYDFLFNVSRSDRFTGLIALSGLNRKFLLESFQQFSTRVAVYSKFDLFFPSAANLFADAVLDLATQIFEAICSQPQGGDWDNLKSFYINYRNSRDYESNESNVSKRARDYILHLESMLISNDYELLINPPLPYLKDLQAKMTNKDPHNPTHMRIFTNKLVARRIALWLYFTKRFSAINIYAVLNRTLDLSAMLNKIRSELINQTNSSNFDLKNIEKKAKNNLDNKAKTLVNTYLSLSLSDFPSGLLLEEKRWFKYHMAVDIYDLEEFFSQITCHVQMALQRWSSKNRKIADTLSQRADLITEDGVPIITSFKQAKLMLSLINKCMATDEEKLEFKALLKLAEQKIAGDVYCQKYLELFQIYLKNLMK
jgi:hypothetical protein